MNTTGLQDSRRPSPPKIPSNLGPQFRAPPQFPGSFANNNFRPPWLPPGYNRGSFPPISNIPNPPQEPPPNRTVITTSTSTTTSPAPTVATTTAKIAVQEVVSNDLEEDSRKRTLQVTTSPEDHPLLLQDLALTALPLGLVCLIFLLSAVSACVFRKKICKTRTKSKKGDKVGTRKHVYYSIKHKIV